MTNFDGSLDNMGDVSRGHQILESPENQNEYLNIQRQNVEYYENLQPEIQNQVDQRILEQLNTHPASAGKVVDTVNGNKGKTLQDSF